MADFATALRTRLIADGDVTAVVGSKIYWGIVPQGTTRPYVRLNTASDPRPEHLKGYQVARTTRVQADCFGDSYGAARGLAEKIITVLADPGVTAGVHFGRIKAEGPTDLGEDTANGFVHRALLDLIVEHKPA